MDTPSRLPLAVGTELAHMDVNQSGMRNSKILKFENSKQKALTVTQPGLSVQLSLLL
jgi:hypothetical protein